MPLNHPRKRFGQHFLEPAWIDKAIDAIDPGPDQVFLEIGPGRGALTRPLAARAKGVLACEIDRDLVSGLLHAAIPKVTVLEGDFLDISTDRLSQQLSSAISASHSPPLSPFSSADADPAPVRVVGNLPYNVASPILFRLVELFAAGLSFIDATVMLQREVADRLTAPPGSRDYGILSILIGHAAAVERIFVLPPGAFRPAPQVQSALVKLRFHAPEPPAERPAVFAALVQAIFTRRRKTLSNALGAFHLSAVCPPLRALSEAGLDGRRRPETLSIPELVALADIFARSCAIVSL